MSKHRILKLKPLPLAAALLFTQWAGAQNITLQDNFTGTSATLNWATFNGACLTAGNGTGKIPACTGLPYYSGVTLKGGQTGTLPDTAGNGALRFTNNTNNENGAVVSNFTFPSGNGLAVTFSTVTYGGTGADGISFFLMDGSKSPSLGALGGSLAYSCSNSNPPYDGLVGAYLGLGMDEYGNFLNQGDNTSSGYGFQAGRIGMRGAGNTSWTWLNANYPSQYPSSLSASKMQAAVQKTCQTGYVWDYSNNSNNPTQTATTLSNYAVIPNAFSVLPAATPLFIGSAARRPDAAPITYQLRITQNGLLSLSYSYNGGTFQPVLSNQSILAANGPLPTTFRFGFAGSTGGANNIHEVTCFTAGPADLSSSSAGINTQQSGQVKTGTQVYLAYYHSNNWWGQLTSQDLVYNAATSTVTINPTANWDASCVLTGGACATTGASITAQTPTSRTMLTWNGTTGIPLRWANLTTTQQNALTAGDTAPVNSNRLDYLRGARTNEINNSGVGLYRARTSVLADIVDSSPLWVGPPALPYPDSWSDLLYPAAIMPESAVGYSTFVTANKTRQNVVYVGADDGLLHGFRAGAYDASNNFVNNSSYPNDGKEILAYMPGASLQSIHSTTSNIDYSNAQYAHAFSVDGAPASGDLFYGGAWHTWLVGGLGPGGNAIYALDITNPANFSETNAASLVTGEWTPTSISCTNFTNCGNSLGQTYDSPQIRRFHNGKWGFVFGNGLNSASGKAGIYVVTIDPLTAAQTSYFLDTGTGSSSTPNGIAFSSPADLDGDHVTDYVYAGDLLGNLWRFDLTSSNASTWGVSQFGNAGATPLFKTPSGQPITTKATVAIVPSVTGASRVMIGFGTGQQVPQTTSAAATYATASQSLYGIWDWDMTAWNVLSITSQKQKRALIAPQTTTVSKLQVQTITASVPTPNTNGVSGYRTVSNTKVCWQGSTDCGSGNTKYGWVLALPGSQEQIVFAPILSLGAFIVNTTIPANNSPLSCTANPNLGWTMAVNPSSGGAFQQSFFGNSQGNFVSYAGGTVSGVQLGAVGRPSVVTAVGNPYLVNQTTAGTGHVDQINPPGGTIGSRLTWEQIR